MSVQYFLAKLYEAGDIDEGRKPLKYKEISNRLIRTWERALKKISEKELVTQYYFRKTYTLRKTSQLYFDCMDPNTWDQRAIQSRLYDQLSEGLNGIVVLGCVTKGMIPSTTRNRMNNPEKMSVGLKSELVSHFTYQEVDVKLQNDSYQPGRDSVKDGAAGILYVAYQFKRRDTNGEDVSCLAFSMNKEVSRKRIRVRDSSFSERSVSPTPKKKKKTKSRDDSSDRKG